MVPLEQNHLLQKRDTVLRWRLTLTVLALVAPLILGTPSRGPGWVPPLEYPRSAALSSKDRKAFISAGIIVTDFDKPQHNWLPGHRGIDLRPPLNTNVLSPAPGTIGFVGKVAGKPVVTVLHSGGLRSTLEPVNTELIKGTEVWAGQVIGTISIDGPWHCPTACVHWGVKNGDDYLDPWKFVRDWVRIILLANGAGS